MLPKRNLQSIAGESERVLIKRLPGVPLAVVVSGAGEFLARRVVTRLGLSSQVISLGARLGPELSQCEPLHMLWP